MRLIVARNVNDAYVQGLTHLSLCGTKENSRNGPVIRAPGPVITQYLRPNERVLFSPERDANPFFHFMEGLWMLGGRQDAAFVTQFNSQMMEYANDQGTFDGAYGWRWRRHFGYDQLMTIVEVLNQDRTTRRAVLSMYNGGWDLRKTSSLDIPCNTHAYFAVRGDELHMTVCCRSNDAIWGAYGANAVHMSMLLEVMAAFTGLKVGTYVQVSNDFHYYPEVKNHAELAADPSSNDMYVSKGLIKHVLVHEPETWFGDLQRFLNYPATMFPSYNHVFSHVAHPMYAAWVAYKSGNYMEAIDLCRTIEDQAWSYVCLKWVERRIK